MTAARRQVPPPAPPTALAFPPGHPQAEEVGDALVRVRAAQTLVDLYDAWLRLRLARAASAAERAREAERLEVQARYLLKSVESARTIQPASPAAPAKKGGRKAAGGKAPAKADPYAAFLASAESELATARQTLQERSEHEERLFQREIEGVQARIKERVEATLVHGLPVVEAHLQPVGQDRALFHLRQPGSDEALLLGYVLSGKLPTRHDAFFDDSVDDLARPPARFYEEDGASARPATADDEDALTADPAREFVPVKGMIAFRLPDRDFPRFRLINRGPLAQIEAREGPGAYEQLLARESAELLSGYLIRLKVEGRLQLTLQVG